MQLRRTPYLRPLPVVLVGYFVVFLLLDWVSFIRPLQHLNITPWNPQPALAVALLLNSRRLWWLVWAGLLAAEVVVRGAPGSLLVDLTIASALTCSYLAIAQLLQRVLGERWFAIGPPEVASLIGVIALGALLNATVYVGIFTLAGFVVDASPWEAMARCWVGDVVGMVVVLPIVLAAMNPDSRQRLLQTLSSHHWWFVAATAGLLLLGLWRADLMMGMDFSYLLLLPMVWGAMQFGSAGALLTSVVTQVGLILAIRSTHQQDLIVFELQLLMAGVAITGWLLGVVVDGRQRAEAELRRSLRLAAAGQMSAALAHELSQPLTALATYAQACKMLLQAGRSLTADEHAQLVEVTRRIGDDALRAGEIVRGLRDFFRRGAAQLEPANVDAIANDAVAEQARRAESLGTQLRCEWPEDLPHVLIDKVQMEVVLRNLVTNAIEASAAHPSGGQVSLSGSRDGDLLLIEVLDNGPGVTATKAIKIFEAGESDKPGGMGIGLSICRAIVEAHSGRLWAEPGPHGHFCLTLPVVQQPGKPSGT